VQVFLIACYIYIVIGDLIIKRGWDIINRFNPAIFFCLSQAKKWFPDPNWQSWQNILQGMLTEDF